MTVSSEGSENSGEDGFVPLPSESEEESESESELSSVSGSESEEDSEAGGFMRLAPCFCKIVYDTRPIVAGVSYSRDNRKDP